MELSDAVPDRLAAALVDNLKVDCTFSECGWHGTRGSLNEHLAKDCPKVMVLCPCCDEEMTRETFRTHQLSCRPRSDCPWGCGEKPANPQAHAESCLLQPRKLLAAVRALSAENERLTRANAALQQQLLASHAAPSTPPSVAPTATSRSPHPALDPARSPPSPKRKLRARGSPTAGSRVRGDSMGGTPMRSADDSTAVDAGPQ